MTNAGETARIGRHTGRRSADDQSVRETADSQIARRLRVVQRRKRRGVFHQVIGKDRDVRSQALSLSKRFRRIAFNDSLIGDHRAGVHVHPNECRTGRGADGQGRERIVAQHVHSEWQLDLAPHVRDHPSHCRYRLRIDVRLPERAIAEVLEQQSVATAAVQRASV